MFFTHRLPDDPWLPTPEQLGGLKIAGGLLGATAILGNLVVFWTPLFEGLAPHGNWVHTCIFLTLLFGWGGGLTGIFLPFMQILSEENTREERRQACSRLTAAVSLGGFLAWLCVAAVETRWDWDPGRSIMTTQFFTTWSLTAAICLVQQVWPLIKLPRPRLVLESRS